MWNFIFIFIADVEVTLGCVDIMLTYNVRKSVSLLQDALEESEDDQSPIVEEKPEETSKPLGVNFSTSINALTGAWLALVTLEESRTTTALGHVDGLLGAFPWKFGVSLH